MGGGKVGIAMGSVGGVICAGKVVAEVIGVAVVGRSMGSLAARKSTLG